MLCLLSSSLLQDECKNEVATAEQQLKHMRWQVELQETRKSEKTQLLTEKKRLEGILSQLQQELLDTIKKEADASSSSSDEARMTREDLIRQERDLQVTF